MKLPEYAYRVVVNTTHYGAYKILATGLEDARMKSKRPRDLVPNYAVNAIADVRVERIKIAGWEEVPGVWSPEKTRLALDVIDAVRRWRESRGPTFVDSLVSHPHIAFARAGDPTAEREMFELLARWEEAR